MAFASQRYTVVNSHQVIEFSDGIIASHCDGSVYNTANAVLIFQKTNMEEPIVQLDLPFNNDDTQHCKILGIAKINNATLGVIYQNDKLIKIAIFNTHRFLKMSDDNLEPDQVIATLRRAEFRITLTSLSETEFTLFSRYNQVPGISLYKKANSLEMKL